MIKQMDKFSKVLFAIIVVSAVLMVAINLIALDSAATNPADLSTNLYFTLMSIVGVIFLGSIVTLLIRAEKTDKKEESKLLEEKKKLLEKEPKEVILNDFSNIPKKYIKCQAQVNEIGKIVCKVKIEEFAFEFESYEKFLKYFSFVEK